MLFLAGKPLIFHTIEAAIQSGEFNEDTIYVSTDSADYAKIIRETGVKVLLRKPELAKDTTTSFDLLEDFLTTFPKDTFFALLQPTSPLRSGKQIKAAIQEFVSQKARHLVSITKADKSPILYTTKKEDGTIPDIAAVDQNYRRQNSEAYYYPNGAIYLSTKEAYLHDRSFFTVETIGYEMEKETSIDVDDRTDFYQAVGARYFNYQTREKNNQLFYANRFAELNQTDFQANWFIGDSRGEKLSLPEGFSNLSMGGITAATVSKNLPTLMDRQTPKRAFVALGVNDLITNYTKKETSEHLEKIIVSLKQVSCEVTLVKVIYTLYVASISNQNISELNKEIAYLAEKWHCELIDPNVELAPEGRLIYEYTTDGLHFSEVGKSILETVYLEAWSRRKVK